MSEKKYRFSKEYASDLKKFARTVNQYSDKNVLKEDYEKFFQNSKYTKDDKEYIEKLLASLMADHYIGWVSDCLIVSNWVNSRTNK